MRDAQLRGANLSKADLRIIDLSRADLREANLRGASLDGGYLRDADLSGADLRNSSLLGANLNRVNLKGANLEGANLRNALLVDVNLSAANIKGCRVYGTSVWNVNVEGANQENLIITSEKESTITVDNLKVAQFIYLLLNNQEIRNVIDSVTSKLVLILGRFTSERKIALDVIHKQLRKLNYLPVIFDFQKPINQDFIETVSTLAHMAKFVIADITDPKIVLEEIPHIVRNIVVPVKPLLLKEAGEEPITLINLRRNHRSLLETLYYIDIEDLSSSLEEKVILPAEALGNEIRTIPK